MKRTVPPGLLQAVSQAVIDLCVCVLTTDEQGYSKLEDKFMVL